MIVNSKLFHYGKCAQYAYFDNAKAKYKELGYTSCKFFDTKGAQAYVASNKNQITICFRGTEPDQFNDIRADLYFFHKQGFHRGFLGEFKKLQPEIEVELEMLQKRKKRPIHVVGHSLGGAIAVVAAYFINGVDEVITFGGPRTTGWFKSKSIPVQVTRVVNNNDIVPKVPFYILGFKHVGNLIYLNYHGNIRSMTPWQRIKDQWRGRLRAFQKGQAFDGLYDHSMNEYCRYLEDEK